MKFPAFPRLYNFANARAATKERHILAMARTWSAASTSLTRAHLTGALSQFELDETLRSLEQQKRNRIFDFLFLEDQDRTALLAARAEREFKMFADAQRATAVERERHLQAAARLETLLASVVEFFAERFVSHYPPPALLAELSRVAAQSRTALADLARQPGLKPEFAELAMHEMVDDFFAFALNAYRSSCDNATSGHDPIPDLHPGSAD